MGQWMDVRILLGCFILLLVGMISYFWNIFWFEGVLPLLILIFLFSFFIVSESALGHIALLEGVSWNIQRLCEHAQCTTISIVTILLLFPTHFPHILFACSYLMLIISCLHSYFLLQTFFSFMHSLTVYAQPHAQYNYVIVGNLISIVSWIV